MWVFSAGHYQQNSFRIKHRYCKEQLNIYEFFLHCCLCYLAADKTAQYREAVTSYDKKEEYGSSSTPTWDVCLRTYYLQSTAGTKTCFQNWEQVWQFAQNPQAELNCCTCCGVQSSRIQHPGGDSLSLKNIRHCQKA